MSNLDLAMTDNPTPTHDVSDLDTPVTEEQLAAYSIRRQAYAASFFRRQVAKYEQHLEPSAVSTFTCWWNKGIDGFRLFTESQQDFDGQAFAACDRWLERWTKRRTKAILTGKIETASQSQDEQEVSRIRASWGISTLAAKRISTAIRQGVTKFVPELRNKSPEWTRKSLLFPEVSSSGESDAIQDAWVKLLTEAKDISGPAARSAGGTAGRQMARKDEHFIPLSQLQNSAPGAPEITFDSLRTAWTAEDYQRSDESRTETALGEMQDDVRLAILAQFRGDNPEDHAFIVDYLKRTEREVIFRRGRRISVSRRGANTTPEERKRAHDILKGLRKWEELELEK
jgi:hypothetical protein